MRVVKALLLILLLAALATGLVLLARSYAWRKHAAEGEILLSGNLEVTDAEVSFRLPGQVTGRLVSEGETVKAGQLVATLDASELRQELAVQQAQVGVAQAALNELLAGSRPEEMAQAEAATARAKAFLEELNAGPRPQEVAAAEAVVRRAQAEEERLAQELKRYAELLGKDAVTVQAEQLIRAQYNMAAASVQEAQERLKLIRAGARDEERAQAAAALAEAQARLALVRAGPRKEAIEQARAQVRQAEEAVKLVATRLGFTQVAAPLGGVVLAHHIEPGEFVAAGTPVLTIGDVANIWLRAYLPEPDLGRVKLGQPVRVTTDSQPGKVYAGQLTFISAEAEFTPKQIQTEKERVKLVYRVKITIANETLALKPGMPADAILEARGP